MRQWRNGVGNAPRHYAGTRSATGRVLSRTRSLTAAAIAVAMMATVAVTSLLPTYNAKADENHNDGAICTPTSISLGTNTGSGTEDTGIATYVGGDMYVGQKVSGDMKNTSGPAGSYAAEAEGLTAVNGKLLLHPLKGVWTTYYTDADGAKNGYVKDYRGFRFGIVGFGGQYRPKTGSTLEVRGNSSDSNIGWVGGAQSWGNAGWIGQTKTTEPNYTANIAGDQTKVYGGSSNDILGEGSSNTNKHKYDDRASVYVPEDTQGTVNWQQNDNQIGSTGETFDGFGSYIKTLSGNLSNLSKQQSESVYVADAKTTTDSEYYNNLVRAKFDGTYSFNISSVHEKIIEFMGNGTSSMQVFNLPASMLNDSSSHTGVSFSFKKIPDTSSVVINVTGGNVDFHNGWRFWWTDANNTTKELGGSYTDGDYAKRAQQIMWNFADASSVTIRGGQGSGTTTRNGANSTAEKTDGVWDGSFPLTTKDDPAAGMLGSILVPNGSFESHVSTNGRVWVGGNYAMYNPAAVGNTGQDGKFYEFVNYERSHSASALDMDQERHNLPWNGSYSTQCAAIAWDKVDASTQEELDNTTWAVYASKNDAQNQSNALKTVTDNAYGDDDSKQGSFSIGGLNPSAIYYIREVSANNTDYATNTNIYTITAGGEGSTARVVTNVYDSKGNEITDSNKKLLPSVGDNSTNAKIANKKNGTSIEWSKIDGSDNGKMLSGSEWQLKKNDSNEAYQITDSTKAVSAVTIQYNGAAVPPTGISLTYNVAVDLTAIVTDANKGTDGVPQAVKWTSSDPTVASVNDGTVLGLKNDTATITACSVADITQCATANITVTGAPADTNNTTTFYFKADGYTSGNTKLHYTLGDPTDSTGWADAVMTTASGCSNWLTVTIENPDLKAVTYLFYQGSNWYHQGSSTTANFTTAANQTVATVENHAATATAPTGCSTGGGSTTIGSVTISGDQHEVGLGKTITLTATPNPSSDTVTWHSGNTSVASVTEGPDTTTTIKGLKVGTTTITAKTSSGATASVTITVKDDSKVGVYFKKSAVNGKWSNYYLHYQKTADYWPAVKMEDACNGDYVVAYIPKVDAHRGYSFLFRDSTDIKSGHWYGSNGENASGDNFTFWDEGAGMHIESNSSKGVGVPSGCQAIQSAAKMEARVSTAVLRSDKTGTVAINDMDDSVAAQSDDSTVSSATNGADTTVYSCGDALGKCDMNTEPGKFRVVDLADGTYTLTETVAPNGYTAGGPYTVTIANGTATITDASGNPIAGNKIPNARNTGTILWNKVSSDSANDKKLGGSEWKLTKTKSFGWNATTGKAEYTDIHKPAIPITDCKLGTGKTCPAPEGQEIYDVDPVEGQFKLEGLEWGTYTLVETKAPDGYDVDSTERTFTFGPTAGTDGTGKWNSNGVESKDGDTTGGFTTSGVDYTSSVFTFTAGNIKNKPGVILPGTGGAGDYWIYAAALVAALIGVVAAGMALKVRRRQ